MLQNLFENELQGKREVKNRFEAFLQSVAFTKQSRLLNDTMFTILIKEKSFVILLFWSLCVLKHFK